MNQRDESEIERSRAPQDTMRTGAGPSQRDDDEDPITSGSPKNLLIVAIIVALLTLGGGVLHCLAIGRSQFRQ